MTNNMQKRMPHSIAHLMAVLCLALFVSLPMVFNAWCGNPSASVAVLTGHGGSVLIPVRPAWDTGISGAYWQGHLLPAAPQQYLTPKGYVLLVRHTVGPKQWVWGKSDIHAPTAVPDPSVPVIRHPSAYMLGKLEK